MRSETMYLCFRPPLPRERFRIEPGKDGQYYRILFYYAPDDDPSPDCWTGWDSASSVEEAEELIKKYMAEGVYNPFCDD